MDANPENWKVGDGMRRLIYNLMRAPPELLVLLAEMYEYTKPEIAGQDSFQFTPRSMK